MTTNCWTWKNEYRRQETKKSNAEQIANVRKYRKVCLYLNGALAPRAFLSESEHLIGFGSVVKLLTAFSSSIQSQLWSNVIPSVTYPFVVHRKSVFKSYLKWNYFQNLEEKYVRINIICCNKFCIIIMILMTNNNHQWVY